MSKFLVVIVCVSLLVSGCRVPPLQAVDGYVADVVSHPIDVAPTPSASKPGEARTAVGGGEAPKPRNVGPAIDAAPPPATPALSLGMLSEGPATKPENVSRASLTQVDRQGPAQKGGRPDDNVIRASMTQIERADPGLAAPQPGKFELTIPKAVPGSEAPLVTLPADRAERPAAVARLFPALPSLPEEPVPQPGPAGRPNTLADLQRLAAANNPLLRQAASDVEAARGLIDPGRPLSQPDGRLRVQSQRQ
jgi:cobalt-zinc-cadmium efflux system outer membrane protein